MRNTNCYKVFTIGNNIILWYVAAKVKHYIKKLWIRLTQEMYMWKEMILSYYTYYNMIIVTGVERKIKKL